MTLQELGGLGEFIGAIAVVISLIYLAAQIRQNTRALNSSAYAQSSEQAWLTQLAVIQNGDLARIMSEHAAGKPLSPEDTARVESALMNYFFAGVKQRPVLRISPTPSATPWSRNSSLDEVDSLHGFSSCSGLEKNAGCVHSSVRADDNEEARRLLL